MYRFIYKSFIITIITVLSCKGDINDIKRVSLAYPKAQILRKDFIIDEFQILHSRVLGASCVLLIVSLIGPERLKVCKKIYRFY